MSTMVTNQATPTYSTTTTSVICESGSINENGTCVCPDTFYGPSCLYKERPCKNGSDDGIQCVCDEGFYGPLCEYPAEGCLNGGYSNDSKCICTDFFTGTSCELLIDIVPVDKIEARINVVVKIDEDFNAKLLNNKSAVYRIFVRVFKTVMLEVYKNVTVFKDIDINDISNGSIVVNHSVIIALNYSLDLTQAYNDTFNQLQEAMNNAPQFRIPCNKFRSGMCFNSSFTKISASDVPIKSGGATRIAPAFVQLATNSVIVNPAEICRGLVPKSYTNYIHNISDHWSLFCVSSCYPGLLNGVNCHYGTCLVTNAGPECRCPDTDIYLFSGKYCENRLHRPSLIGGLTVAVFVIILIIVAVLMFFCRRRYRSRHGSYYPREINGKFPLFLENSGVFLSAKPRPSVQEGPQGNIHPTKIPGIKVYLEKLDTSIKMAIKRPQVVKSNYA
ncbi:mucin-3A-like isoform X2 [Pleurodeles waltl]|uniref:mucin-3A-like isoform X2 n=1 Tax=Pleurodeles waltl TaxID=8319 RepID=UPI00370985FC